MQKLTSYIATSLNGKIARANGEVDWLEAIPNPNKTDYGYSEFYGSIGTTIMGYKTYEQVINWGIDFPYPDKKNYVFTNKSGLENTEYVEFISENHAAFTRKLKEEATKNIWLIGGGQINTFLLNEGLIDELHMHVMPIILPDGIELFELVPKETQLKLISSKQYESGVMELKYELN